MLFPFRERFGNQTLRPVCERVSASIAWRRIRPAEDNHFAQSDCQDLSFDCTPPLADMCHRAVTAAAPDEGSA
jgi:hypothetical protein